MVPTQKYRAQQPEAEDVPSLDGSKGCKSKYLSLAYRTSMVAIHYIHLEHGQRKKILTSSQLFIIICSRSEKITSSCMWAIM